MVIAVDNVKREGLGIIVICNDEVSFRWMMHMTKVIGKLPSGIFWKYIPILKKFNKEKGINYASCRNDGVREAQKLNLKYILFLDADVFLPYGAVSKLMSNMNEDVKIVSGVYYKKNAKPFEPVVYEQWGAGPYFDIKNKKGLVNIHTAGMGCVMIDLDIFDKFDAQNIPYFKQDWIHIRDNGMATNVPLGEDYWFFDKAQKLGFKSKCDADVKCGHYDVKARQMWDENGIHRFNEDFGELSKVPINQNGEINNQNGNVDKRNKVKK